jgi:hypothetical protein
MVSRRPNLAAARPPPPCSDDGHSALYVSTTNSLNFSKSGWWGKIFSEMKVLIPILIDLLVGCGVWVKKAGTARSQHC